MSIKQHMHFSKCYSSKMRLKTCVSISPLVSTTPHWRYLHPRSRFPLLAMFIVKSSFSQITSWIVNTGLGLQRPHLVDSSVPCAQPPPVFFGCRSKSLAPMKWVTFCTTPNNIPRIRFLLHTHNRKIVLISAMLFTQRPHLRLRLGHQKYLQWNWNHITHYNFLNQNSVSSNVGVLNVKSCAPYSFRPLQCMWLLQFIFQSSFTC